MTFHRRAALASLLTLPAAGMLALSGSAQARAAMTFHDTFPAGPGTFTCTGGNLDVTGGTINLVFHENQDTRGYYHVTGTLTPKNVTLTNAAGDAFTLSGASWFGSTSTDPNGNDIIVATDTEHFVIRRASGGLYAKVQFVEHLSPNGSSFTFDRGTCETPNN